MHSNKKDVDKFLRDVKTSIEKNNIIPINRHKNIETSAELGIEWKDAIDEKKIGITQMKISYGYLKRKHLEKLFI